MFCPLIDNKISKSVRDNFFSTRNNNDWRYNVNLAVYLIARVPVDKFLIGAFLITSDEIQYN